MDKTSDSPKECKNKTHKNQQHLIFFNFYWLLILTDKLQKKSLSLEYHWE